MSILDGYVDLNDKNIKQLQDAFEKDINDSHNILPIELLNKRRAVLIFPKNINLADIDIIKGFVHNILEANKRKCAQCDSEIDTDAIFCSERCAKNYGNSF